MQIGAGPGIEIPASALTRADGQPAVWVVDPATETVALRNIEVVRHDPARASSSRRGSSPATSWSPRASRRCGPGQKVRLLGAAR